MFMLASMTSCLASTAAACACTSCTYCTKEAINQSARLGYSILFTFSLLISWILRDFAKPLLMKIPWIIRRAASGSELPPDDWFARQAVYRISMGNFLMFGILAAIMWLPSSVKYKSDWRAKLHHATWPMKLVMWLAANIIPFFFSNGLINFYSWIARLGSPLFLCVQMLTIIDMAGSWNEAWVAEGESDENYLYALLGVTVVAYAGTISTAGVLYHYFAPSGHDCSFNISIITLALLLCLLLSMMTFHPIIRQGNPSASIFPAACTSLYIMYLGYSAMQSEPHDYECNTLGQKINAASGTTLAAGMVLTLVSVVYAAFRAGSNTNTFGGNWHMASGGDSASEHLLHGDNEEEELTSAGLDGLAPQQNVASRNNNNAGLTRFSSGNPGSALANYEPVTYSYAQFYLVFALASLYISMLMTGWGAGIRQQDIIDVGWTSVWVKILSQWALSALYAWTLVAPIVLADRAF